MTTVRIVVLKGPGDQVTKHRLDKSCDLAEKVKIQFGSGYEHYSNSGELAILEGMRYPLFRWCGRTKIAE